MRLLRRFPLIVIALVLMGIAGLGVAQGDVVLFLVAAALAVSSWYVTEGPRGRTLPRWAANGLAIVVTAGALFDAIVLRGDILDVLSRYSVGLVVVKLYERRTARDHAHLMGLSLLLILIGCLQTQRLLFGIILAVYAALGLYALLLYRLYASHERHIRARRTAFPAAPPPAQPPPLPTAAPGPPPATAAAAGPTIGLQMASHFRRLAAAVAVAGMVLSIVLFLIFPRSFASALPNPGFGRGPGSRTTAYSDSIDLSAGTRINESSRPVLDLELLDDEGRHVRLQTPLLLRGAVLDRYDNGRWTATGGATTHLVTAGIRPEPLAKWSLPPGAGVTQRVRFRTPMSTVFSLYVPTSVSTERPHEFSYDGSAQTITSADRRSLGGYEVEARPEPADDTVRLLTRGASTRRLVHGYFRSSPDAGAGRVRKLAQRILADAKLGERPLRGDAKWRWNERAARALTAYLDDGSYVYTLELGNVVRRERDPIVDFLFSSRRGHCEFFASALAALCDAVEIDVRLVTGYVAVTFDEETQSYPVQERNAHAWVEVRTGPSRFTPIDPTPPAILRAPAREESLAERFGWLYRQLEGSWTANVVQFDDRAQADLLQAIDPGWSRRLGSAAEATRRWMAAVNRAFRLGPAGYVWLGIMGVLVVLAVAAVVSVARRHLAVRRALRLKRVRPSEARRFARQLAFYFDMLAVLRAGGCAKPAWQPPLAFAHDLEAARDDVARLVREIAGVYYEARYAGRRLSGTELSRARRRVAELARVLKARRRRVGGWR